MQILDKIGQEITEGCYIAYGHALGRCAGLRVGKVLKISYKEEYDTAWKKNITTHAFTVWGVNDDWDHKEPHLLSKKSTIFFPERIVVLHSLPEQLKKLLEPITIDTKLKPCPVCISAKYHFDCKNCQGTGKVI